LTDLIHGRITKNLVRFAIPLFFGSLFQQLYHTVDSLIVSWFVNEDAFGAVGIATPIINVALFLIVGVCLGAGVLIGEFFGAGDMETLRREFSTTLLFGGGLTILISIPAFLLADPILRLFSTPLPMLPDATVYLQVTSMGMFFSFLYNIYASSLRAVGDSKTPVVFLIVSSCLNVLLDLLFVPVLEMEVFGAALATTLSQAISVVLCFFYTQKKVAPLRLRRKDLRIDPSLLKRTVSYSWVSAVQQCSLHLGRLLVVGAVTPLGSAAVNAYTAVGRIDALLLIPPDNMNVTLTTFTSQNRGAGNYHRILPGYLRACTIAIGTCVLALVAQLFFAEPLASIFLTDADSGSLPIATEYLQTISLFYPLLGLCSVSQGFFRGMGNLKITLAATIINVSTRVVFSYILTNVIALRGVAFAIGLAWFLMSSFEVITLLLLWKKSLRDQAHISKTMPNLPLEG